MFLSLTSKWTHFKNIYKRNSMDACLFSLFSGCISDQDILRTCSRKTNKNKRAYGVFYPWLCTCVCATADMCLCTESYCGFSKNRFLLQKYNFRLLPGLLGIWVIGHTNQQISACSPGQDFEDPLILVPVNAHRCHQVHRHLLGDGRVRRGLKCQKNKKLVMS